MPESRFGSASSVRSRSREEADLVLLAGDLTTHGLPEQAAVLADACRAIEIPIVAVLGNHDHHSGFSDEIADSLEAAGVIVLDRSHVILEIGDVEVGIAGTKGFVGGFPGAEIADFGEPALRQVYGETTLEVEALERGLEEIAGCHKTVVLLHYAPCRTRSSASRRRSGPSSARVASPARSARTDRISSCTGTLITARPHGAIGEVPVHNVAVQVTGQDFASSSCERDRGQS